MAIHVTAFLARYGAEIVAVEACDEGSAAQRSREAKTLGDGTKVRVEHVVRAALFDETRHAINLRKALRPVAIFLFAQHAQRKSGRCSEASHEFRQRTRNAGKVPNGGA